MATKQNSQWIEHKYLYTYRIASEVEEVARNHMSYLRELEALTVDFGIAQFVPNWQKDTALHKFIRYIADCILEEDNSGDRKVPFGDDPIHPRWTIPVEAALVTYEIQDEIDFELPQIPPIATRNGNVTTYKDSPELLDACFEYFQGLRLTQAYEDLLHRLSEEVFFVMFTNRVTLQCLHEYLAHHVLDEDMDWALEEYPEISQFYTKLGRIRRTAIPKWARRAVFFRDRGLCTGCKKNISGLVNPFAKENYDHIVPLAKGGLNCVTNLQLLCEACNNKKADQSVTTSDSYQRWY